MLYRYMFLFGGKILRATLYILRRPITSKDEQGNRSRALQNQQQICNNHDKTRISDGYIHIKSRSCRELVGPLEEPL
eukprot:3818603-Amphidinium_carterae.1